MTQNRKGLISRLIGNLSNAVVHKVLRDSIKDDRKNLVDSYRKEMENRFDIAIKYREKITPFEDTLHVKDVNFIREEIIKRSKSELNKRIEEGYDGINLDIVQKIADEFLKKLKIV